MGANAYETTSVKKAIEQAEQFLREDKSVSAGSKTVISLLLMLIKAMMHKLGVDSTNSSTPPSQDPFRATRGKKKVGAKGEEPKKSGGQHGHKGSWLQPTKEPDKIHVIKVDRRTLPHGHYSVVGFDARQVVDIEINRVVTEFRAEILEDEKGNKFVAEFPTGVTRPAQYGASVKAQAVYMSQQQLLPYERLQSYFSDQCGIPLSQGSLANFNETAFKLLEPFESAVKKKLLEEQVLQADETGINIAGKLKWLHTLGSPRYAVFFPHDNRGDKAMIEMGVLPNFRGILCHDHWKAYFKLDCLHSLCNAHHLRELEAVHQNDGHEWPVKMQKLLRAMNASTGKTGHLAQSEAKKFTTAYRKVLADGEKECPATTERPKGLKRGRIAQGKARNLLDRLRDFEEETLHFLTHPLVPFTNNRSENDIRMTKVQQKISGCFRSRLGAQIFCRIRGYLLTCQKHEVGATEALQALFAGCLPENLQYLGVAVA